MHPQPAAYWEIISYNLLAAGWSYDYGTFGRDGTTMHRVAARRGERLIVVQSDDILAAFVEFEAETRKG